MVCYYTVMEEMSEKNKQFYQRSVEELNELLDTPKTVDPRDYDDIDDYFKDLGLVRYPHKRIKDWRHWSEEEQKRYLKLSKKARMTWALKHRKPKKFNKKEVNLAKLIGAAPEINIKKLMRLAGYSPKTLPSGLERNKYWDELLAKYVNDDELMDRMREFAKGEDKHLAFKSIVKLLEWKHRKALKDTQVKEAVERRIIFD